MRQLAEELKQNYAANTQIVVADLTHDEDVAAVEAVIASAESLETVVNCAGSGALGKIDEVSATDLDAMLKLNVIALTRLTQAAVKNFKAHQTKGTLINIASFVISLNGGGLAAYCGSKAHVLHFSRGLQEELAADGIKVQAVLAGLMSSEFFGGEEIPFPAHLVTTPDKVVDASLQDLADGVYISIPSLHDEAKWPQYEAARLELMAALTQNGSPAARYGL